MSIDLGCGEGTFGAALFGDEPQNFCGIDLSRRAILLARKKLPSATWVQANADRRLPVSDATCHRVLSLFGRRPVEEIRRILAPGGICIIAVPGSNDLIELREHVQEAGHQRDRTALIVEQFSKEGLHLTDRAQWSHRVELDREAISDALAMTYRGVRHSQQARLESLDSLHVTLEAELMKFEPARESATPISGP